MNKPLTRRIDDLGRIVIPHEIRKALSITDGTQMDISVDSNSVVIRKHGEDPVPTINMQNDDFGAVLNCAIRYCIGRRTYMPDLVTSYIRPLLPYLNYRTVNCMWNDIRMEKNYGDPYDEVIWMNFLQDLVAELDRRDKEDEQSKKDA